MITSNETRKITGTLNLEHEKYTVTSGNLIKLIQQAICTYKNPLKSVIREYAVNGRDAMKLTGIMTPLIVTTPTILEPKLKIRDFGGGLTDEEVKDLLFSFGASGEHKQVSNRYVGGFGIGSKSAFNLTDSFLFTVFKNGKQTVWNCIRDKNQYPSAAKVSESETTEPDGILVTIPCKPFDEIQAHDVLKWLDVPAILNCKPVIPYTKGCSLSGSGSLHVNGEAYDMRWSILKTKFPSDITFVVGCGAIEFNLYSTPSVYSKADLPQWLRGKLVIELPPGSASLMTSREDFIFDDKTTNILAAAIKASTNGIEDRILQPLYAMPDPNDALNFLADLRRTYGANVFDMFLSRCRGHVRTYSLDAIKRRLCRKLEISPTSGICEMLISFPTRTSRGYSNAYRYKTQALVSENFTGSSDAMYGPYIYRAKTQLDMWSGQFSEEFSRLCASTNDGSVDRVYSWPMCSDGTNTPRNRNSLILEGLGWKNMEIHIYPTTTRKFMGPARDYVRHAPANENSALILTLRGDVAKIKFLAENQFPGAKIVTHENVACYKTGSGRVVGAEHAPGIRRPLVGWLAEISFSQPNDQWMETPEKIVARMLSKYHTRVTISKKTSFKELENSNSRVLAIHVCADNRNDETVLTRVRMQAMNALLANLDVYKSENKVPVVAMLDMPQERNSSASHWSAPVVPGVTFVTDATSIMHATQTDEDMVRQALWMYRMTEGGDLLESCGLSEHEDRTWVDISAYSSNYRFRYLDALGSSMMVCAPLFERVMDRLLQKRLCPRMRENVKLLKRLYTRPKVFRPGDNIRFPQASNPAFVKFQVALRFLLEGSPIAEYAVRSYSKYDIQDEKLEPLANNLVTLMLERNACLAKSEYRKKKEEKNDNEQ